MSIVSIRHIDEHIQYVKEIVMVNFIHEHR